MSLAWGKERIESRRLVRAGHVEDLLQLLYPELQKPLRECRLLDLGSGLGTNAIPAAKIVRSVHGVEIEPAYAERARTWAAQEGLTNVTFEVGSATEVDAGPFDIVLCDYLLEHIPNPDLLVAVIARHLDPDGAYYLSTNNKWWPLEGHFGMPLPLISWLPRPWADRYIRVLGLGKEYNVYPVSWPRLRSMLDRHGLSWTLKPPLHPYTAAQKVGKRLVGVSPAVWSVANVFQVVGRRADGRSGPGAAPGA